MTDVEEEMKAFEALQPHGTTLSTTDRLKFRRRSRASMSVEREMFWGDAVHCSSRGHPHLQFDYECANRLCWRNRTGCLVQVKSELMGISRRSDGVFTWLMAGWLIMQTCRHDAPQESGYRHWTVLWIHKGAVELGVFVHSEVIFSRHRWLIDRLLKRQKINLQLFWWLIYC